MISRITKDNELYMYIFSFYVTGYYCIVWVLKVDVEQLSK